MINNRKCEQAAKEITRVIKECILYIKSNWKFQLIQHVGYYGINKEVKIIIKYLVPENCLIHVHQHSGVLIKFEVGSQFE